jgi:pregnancy-associated plasma protein-A/IPT/TIG domain-containing protein
MSKPIWKGVVALALTAAVAAGALVATSAASTGSSSAGKASAASGTAPCVLPIVKGPLAAMMAGSRHRKDLVTNQYDLPTPSTVSPFFTGPHNVNVYFHVIMDGPNTVSDDDSTGDIPQTWITDQISVLNAAYAGSGFQFTLQGTDRTENAAWFEQLIPGSEETAMKTALHKGGYWDLNVYTADLGFGLLGWATFPVKNAKGTKLAMDGVVIYHESLPGGNADFGTDAVYNQGDTLTHEAGHWLSLYHTFQGGCSKKGDQVADTPAEAAPNFTCDPIDSCPNDGLGPDLIHNFMDYGDDICLDSFTAGQTARMQANWDTLRNLVPVVKKLKPSKGLVGTSVTISGSALSDASAVMFTQGSGTVSATFTVVDDTTITATVPVGATTGPVTVVGTNGTTVSKKKFTVTL